MYPVRLGFDGAIKRMRKLIRNGHSAEALLASVFCVEKTLRRTLRQLVVSAGFTSKQAETLCSTVRGFDAIKKNWRVFDPHGRTLPSFVTSTQWQDIKTGVEMRNKLAHGERVYELAACKKQATAVLDAFSALRTAFQSTYGFDGWERIAVRRKSRLHANPKVNMGNAEPEN